MDTIDKSRTVRVAAVQVQSQHGQVAVNHAHALPFIEEAAKAGADLAVLPELFSSGYIPNETLWDSAEPEDGPTTTWLRETSKRLGIYLGAGLVETDGQDFYNVFVLTGPKGEVAGKVHKAEAESYIFKRSPSSNVIYTSLGIIGVGICAENHIVSFMKKMHEQSVDLVLMPHGWPTPTKTGKGASEEDIKKAQNQQRKMAQLYAHHLGVPAAFVNGVGSMGKMVGILGSLMDPEVYRLEGRSQIVDSDETIKGELETEEGVIVAEVTLNPACKRWIEPVSYDGWLHPGVAVIRKVIIPLENNLGQFLYKRNSRRIKKAQGIISYQVKSS